MFKPLKSSPLLHESAVYHHSFGKTMLSTCPVDIMHCPIEHRIFLPKRHRRSMILVEDKSRDCGAATIF